MSQSKLLSFNPQPLSVAEVLNESMAFVEEEFKSKEVSLVKKVEAEGYLLADNDIRQTTLRNILANALKFTPRKGVVELIVSEQKKCIELR
ncbi:MAG: signal transduction histidine kinase [Luteibaculaceae bacterium]|jgi:signal transduction histidine kinase